MVLGLLHGQLDHLGKFFVLSRLFLLDERGDGFKRLGFLDDFGLLGLLVPPASLFVLVFLVAQMIDVTFILVLVHYVVDFCAVLWIHVLLMIMHYLLPILNVDLIEFVYRLLKPDFGLRFLLVVCLVLVGLEFLYVRKEYFVLLGVHGLQEGFVNFSFVDFGVNVVLDFLRAPDHLVDSTILFIKWESILHLRPVLIRIVYNLLHILDDSSVDGVDTLINIDVIDFRDKEFISLRPLLYLLPSPGTTFESGGCLGSSPRTCCFWSQASCI